MAYTETQLQSVHDKITKKLLRQGYCDFLNDGNFNSDVEEIVEFSCNNCTNTEDYCIHLKNINETDWYYNEELNIYEELV